MLRTVVSECADGQTCPAVYTDEDATVLVRGYVEQRLELELPDGEAVVRVPRALLEQAAHELAR